MPHAQPSVVQSAGRDAGRAGASIAPYAFEDLVDRIRAEFIEQPGLRLTEAQGCRLWQLDRATLQRVLAALTATAFLSASTDGRYARRSVV